MELFKIGKTQKPHGLTGEIRVVVEDIFLDELSSFEVLFIKVGAKPIPYFVESLTFGNLPNFKLEDVNTREDARKIGSKDLFVRKSDLSFDPDQVEDNDLHYGFLKGFEINDKSIGKVGTIVEILEFPQQEMAVIELEDKEIFIPLNDSFILSIDEVKKLVLMELPEGIVEL